MRLKQFFHNLSFKYKILSLFFCFIFIISSVLGLYFFNKSKAYVINRVSSVNLSLVEQLSNDIHLLLKDTEEISTFICISPDVQNTLSKNPNSNDTDMLKSNSALNFTNYIFGGKDYLNSICIYGNSENPVYYYIQDGSMELYGLSEIQKSKIYDSIAAFKGKPFWFTIGEGDHFFMHKSKSEKLCLGRIIKDSTFSKKTGLLFISMRSEAIKNLYKKILQNQQQGVLIVDEEGSVISQSGFDFYSSLEANHFYSKEIEKNPSGNKLIKISDKEVLVSYGTVSGTGWKVFYAFPMSSTMKEISSIRFMTLLVILLCLILSLPIILFITFWLTSPIKKLLDSMKRFQEGNFEEKVDFKYNDEIGKLGDGYNIMVSKIKDLIHSIYILEINEKELKLKEREAELNALQAQINPHFLYNTLDTIYWKAYGGNENETEISSMVYSLSKFFRLGLNRGRSFTSVAMEKELLENYLILQKIRYKDKLNYEIRIDPNIMEIEIPKLILQPFVENSIIHGLEGKEGNGLVITKGFIENNYIHFIIEDNGSGISDEKIQALLDTSSEDMDKDNSQLHGGYAIKNILERLKLIYDTNFSLKITSTPLEGTSVEIIIPVNRSKDAKE